VRDGQDVGVDLETVADELYALQPAEFTGARDARASEARKSGDRELAAAIKALRRPTTSAWLANLLARTRSDQVAELLEMGEALREAQANLSGDDLRRLSAQRHRVVSALAQEARRVAYEQGERISDAVQQELEGTLEAALADPRAGEAVRNGRLTGALSYSGLGEVDLSSVVSLGGPTGRQAAKKPAAKAQKPARDDKQAAQERDAERRQRAEEKLAAARERLAEAKRTADSARAEAEDAGRQVDELTAQDQQVHERIRELESELEDAQERASRLASAVREAKRSRTTADRAASSSAHRLEQAEAAVAAAEQELSA
jgi:predicted ribosome quality control (RQC) complex YloA/Tae2 family protein